MRIIDDDDLNNVDNVAQMYFDPDLVDISEGFNDDEELLVIGKSFELINFRNFGMSSVMLVKLIISFFIIDGKGNVIKLRGRINVKTV